MLALQELGERLVALSSDQIEQIELPEELREAVVFARNIRKHGARRRQLQYIGTLMREVDPEPIRQAVTNILQGQNIAKQVFQEVEQWRDELILLGEEGIEDVLRRFPNGDRQRLRQLVRNARKEKEAQRPPKSSRALFRYLKVLAEASGKPEP